MHGDRLVRFLGEAAVVTPLLYLTNSVIAPNEDTSTALTALRKVSQYHGLVSVESFSRPCLELIIKR
jgi:hypothetical protein